MQFDEFFFCYKDITRKAFFTMTTLLMPLLENVDCTYIIGLFSDFPGRCYSWTSGKWFNPNDTWSLKPFCGAARCVGNAN